MLTVFFNKQVNSNEGTMKNKNILTLIFIMVISTSVFSSNSDEKGIKISLIRVIYDNNCAYFTEKNYNKDELLIATGHSKECAEKYYTEIIDSNNFEQVVSFIAILVMDNNTNLALTVYQDTLNNFKDMQKLQVVNTICLGSEDYQLFLNLYIEEFPWNKDILRNIEYCKVRFEKETD